MTQRNQAGQDAGDGEVFVECIEKLETPDFGFSRHGEIGAWLSQRRVPKQKLDFEDQIRIRKNLGDGLHEKQSSVHSNDSGKPKWKSWLAGVYSDPPGSKRSL